LVDSTGVEMGPSSSTYYQHQWADSSPILSVSNLSIYIDGTMYICLIFIVVKVWFFVLNLCVVLNLINKKSSITNELDYSYILIAPLPNYYKIYVLNQNFALNWNNNWRSFYRAIFHTWFDTYALCIVVEAAKIVSCWSKQRSCLL
jgi:hypothetical protein